MALALSHGGNTIYRSDAPSDEVLVGTNDGVVAIERDGSGWRVKRRSLEGLHIHAVLFEERSGVWFAGANKGGIFASEDGGATWERRDDGVTESDIYSLACAEIDGDVRLFAGTEPAHLFVSDDLGHTWTEKPGLRQVATVDSWSFPGPPHVAHLKHINFAPGNPHTIFASIEVGALLKSEDDGETWVDVTGMYEDVHRTVINPVEPDRMYVTGGGGIWTTEDGGKSWANDTAPGSEVGGYPDQLVFKPSNPDYMIVSAGQKSPGSWRVDHTTQTRISRSHDGGRTWEVLGGGLQDKMQHAVEAMCIEEAGSTVQLFAGTTGGQILWSDDGGDHWATAVDGLAPISKGGHYRGITE